MYKVKVIKRALELINDHEKMTTFSSLTAILKAKSYGRPYSKSKVLRPNFKSKVLRSYSKSKLELESNLAKLCQLIAILPIVLLQLNLTKLKLDYLKFGFQCKKER